MLELIFLWIGFFLFGFLLRYLFSKKKYSTADWHKKQVFIKQMNMVLSTIVILMGLFSMYYHFLGLISIITGISGIILADKKADEMLYNKEKINSKRKNKKINKVIDDTQDYF